VRRVVELRVKLVECVVELPGDRIDRALNYVERLLEEPSLPGGASLCNPLYLLDWRGTASKEAGGHQAGEQL
jgi:hypothetical protein